ncbi:MAG: hypothetical protein IJN49_00605, partial [Clostridia bacterium]|nr:hypothetical protein [Clostridia bacterium]
MKKVLSLLLTVCLLMTAFSVNAFAADSSEEANANLTKEYTEIFSSQLNRGDLNGDNKVTVDEAKKFLRIAARLDEPEANVNYDLTGDGKVTTEDARRALRIASGLEMGATDEEIFNYFKNEINTVKITFPGFDRTVTSQCTDARIAVTGAPKIPLYPDINANYEEIRSYYKRTEKTWKLVASDEEYKAMLDDAESTYEPDVVTKTVDKGSKSHYTYFPVMSLSNTCRLDFEDIKDIKLDSSKDGKFIITMTMDKYTYDEKNPYPATTYEATERENLPYGKIFNLPTFNQNNQYEVEKVVLDEGKVILTVDSATGRVIDADFTY